MDEDKKQQQKWPMELRKDPTSGRWAIVQNAIVQDGRTKPADAGGSGDSRYKPPESHLLRYQEDFKNPHCVFSRQFAGGKRQEKEVLFGLRWSKDQTGQVEITYDWHGDDWEVMVVRTDYAQLVPDRSRVLLGEDAFVAEAGFGVHELIIGDPTESHLPLGFMDPKRTQLILLAMLYRLNGRVAGYPELDAQNMLGVKPLRETEGVRHVSFFHNHRPESGGSQEHPHSQILASPIIPTEVSAELEHALRRQQQPAGRCVYCEIIEAERAIWEREREPGSQNYRILFETKYFLAIQAYAAIYPFETWIIPKWHASSFAALSERDKAELIDLAGLIDIVLQRLYACLDDPAYNLILKSEPVTHADEVEKYSNFHWHIRIEPRGLTAPAGYELSTGIFTSPTPPEGTAEFLRNWGILAIDNEHTDGTLGWYLRLSKLAATGWVREVDLLVRRLDKCVKSLKDPGTTVLEITVDTEITALYPKLRAWLDPLWIGAALETDGIGGSKENIPAKEDFEQGLDHLVSQVRDITEKGSWEAIEVKVDDLKTVVLYMGTILAAVKRAPIKLRNIVQVLGQSAAEVSGFSRAKVWIERMAERKPELFLTQSKLPPESSQRLQTTPETGGYDGPHYRRCPATGRWVLIPSKQRRKRTDIVRAAQLSNSGRRWLPKNSPKECSFCNDELRKKNKLLFGVDGRKGELVYGKEPIGAWPVADDWKKDWGCYLIENIKPIFTRMDETEPHPPRGGIGSFESIQGKGVSDLIVIGCNDEKIIVGGKHSYEACVTVEHLECALMAVHERTVQIRMNEKNKAIRHVAVFSNHRTEAGAHFSHVNWQLIASPIVPTGIAREIEHGHRYFKEYFGRCCFCDMIQAERQHRQASKGRTRIDRIIVDEEMQPDYRRFLAIAPYASRSPYEVWIMPTEHQSSINVSLEKADSRKALAQTLSDVLISLHGQVGDPGYSMLIQNAPVPHPLYPDLYLHYHWRIIIETQKLMIPAGYEHLTGIWSNPVAPEEAAEVLRKGLPE